MATGGGGGGGAICWAKMRGFPSWPAQLLDGNTSASSLMVRVEFFGTHDTASVPKLELEPWQGTNFEQLCGKSKAKAFKLAVKEAAAAYNGALPATSVAAPQRWGWSTGGSKSWVPYGPAENLAIEAALLANEKKVELQSAGGGTAYVLDLVALTQAPKGQPRKTRRIARLEGLEEPRPAGVSPPKATSDRRIAPAADSEPSRWQVGQLVEARAQNSGARAGYEHCRIKAVQADGRYTVRFTDEGFDQRDIGDILALGASLGARRRRPEGRAEQGERGESLQAARAAKAATATAADKKRALPSAKAKAANAAQEAAAAASPAIKAEAASPAIKAEAASGEGEAGGSAKRRRKTDVVDVAAAQVGIGLAVAHSALHDRSAGLHQT
jgi:hypothetical protein